MGYGTEIWSTKMSILKQLTNLHLNSVLCNEFYLSQPQIDTLSSHYILHWTGHYLKSRISIHSTITHTDIEYICILPPCVRKKFYEADGVKLSFRKPKTEFNIPPYVLVRFA